MEVKPQGGESQRSTHPAKKALKGKSVTRTQYANCAMPESMMKMRYASTSFSLNGVVSL